MHSARSEGLSAFSRRLLGDAAPEESAILCHLPGRELELAPHRSIELGDSTGRCVGFVLEGMVTRFRQFRNGNRLATALYLPGDPFGLDAVVHEGTVVSVDAVTGARILQIPAARLGQVARDHPRIMAALWRLAAADSARTREWLVTIGGRPAAQRMAFFLCEMACRLGGEVPAGPCAFDLPVAQNQIGELLSLTSVHVNRMLSRLKTEGLASVHKPLVDIPDWERLAAFAGFDPAYLSLGRPGEAGARAAAAAPAATRNGFADHARHNGFAL